MKKNVLAGLVASVLMVSMVTTAGAVSITVTSGAKSLAHAYAYVWGVESSTWDKLGDPITSASIQLTGVWDDNASGYNNDQLALFLFDDAFMSSRTATWYSYSDNSKIVDHRFANTFLYRDSLNANAFDGITALETYKVPVPIPNYAPGVTLTYTFTAANLTTLTNYLGTGVGGLKYRDIALGFDPDCHFRVGGFSFTVSDDRIPVPEPGTLMLLGSGLIGLAAIRKKRKNQV